jgi:hypothetical protein
VEINSPCGYTPCRGLSSDLDSSNTIRGIDPIAICKLYETHITHPVDIIPEKVIPAGILNFMRKFSFILAARL